MRGLGFRHCRGGFGLGGGEAGGGWRRVVLWALGMWEREREGRGWRERVRGVRMPRWGRRGGSAGGNGNAEVGGGVGEGISGSVGTTPAQLEEGRTGGVRCFDAR